MRYIICSLNSELIGKIYIFNNNSPFNTNKIIIKVMK